MDRQAAILAKTPVQTIPAQKMRRAAGCTARPKRTEAGREAFSVRGPTVMTQDFVKFWGNFFVFILLVLIENSQGFKTF
jgi:hypothetical protein